MPYSDAKMKRFLQGQRENEARNTWPCPEPEEGRIHFVSWAPGLKRTLCPKAKNYHELQHKLGQNQVTTTIAGVTCLTCTYAIEKLETRRRKTDAAVPIDFDDIQAYWDKHGEGDPLPLEVFHG